jgi:hypothetical protein
MLWCIYRDTLPAAAEAVYIQRRHEMGVSDGDHQWIIPFLSHPRNMYHPKPDPGLVSRHVVQKDTDVQVQHQSADGVTPCRESVQALQRAVGARLKGLDRSSGTHVHLACPAESPTSQHAAQGPPSVRHSQPIPTARCLTHACHAHNAIVASGPVDGRGEKGSGDGVTSHDWTVARGLCRQSILGSGQNSGGRP